MSKLVGKKADAAFNAFAFRSEIKKSNGDTQEVFMLGLFKEQRYDSNVRSGWIQHSSLVSDLMDTLSYEEQTITGTVMKSGKQFVLYLDQMPAEVENRDGKPRYDCRPVRIVGFEIPE